MPWWIGLVVGVPLVGVGIFLVWSASKAFSRSGTALVPNEPTTKIVRDGPYAFSRNPIYLAFALIYLGFAFAFSSIWAMGLLIPVLIFIDRDQIAREEKYLERKFGEEYVRYKSKVRRWL